MLRRPDMTWPFDWLDGVAFAGVLLVAGGLGAIWAPLAGIVVGGALLGWAVLAAIPARVEPGEP